MEVRQHWQLTSDERAERVAALRASGNRVANVHDSRIVRAVVALEAGGSPADAQHILTNETDGKATQVNRARGIVLDGQVPNNNDNTLTHASLLLRTMLDYAGLSEDVRRGVANHYGYINSALERAKLTSTKSRKVKEPTSDQERQLWVREAVACLGAGTIVSAVFIAQFLLCVTTLSRRPGKVDQSSLAAVQRLLADHSPDRAYVYVLKLWFLPILKVGRCVNVANRLKSGTDFGLGWTLQRVYVVSRGTESAAEAALHAGLVRRGQPRMRDWISTAGNEWFWTNLRTITATQKNDLPHLTWRVDFRPNYATQTALVATLRAKRPTSPTGASAQQRGEQAPR